MVEAGQGRGWALRVWALAWLVAYLATAFAEELPTPAPVDAPAQDFAEARARPLLLALTEHGPRVPGTAAYDRAVATLAAALAEIPGVEVEVVRVEGSAADPDSPQVVRSYRAVNVLARLPGRSPEAVMIAAHFDSPAESPGAGDDGVGVVVAVEALRALAAGPAPARTILVTLDGAEESGTLGADAFVAHPWRAAVVAAINLEGTADGRTLAFEAGPRPRELLAAYGSAVRRPHASGVAEDMFRSGLLGHYTNFRVYGEQAGIPTIDLANYGDFWAYHSALDTAARVRPGVLQHMGACTLELARGLADAAWDQDDRGDAQVLYTDLLGRVTLRLSPALAGLLAALALALALAVARRSGAPWLLLLRECARLGLGMLAAVVAAALAGVALIGVGRAQVWYASPGWGVLGFVLTALAAGVAAAVVRRARPVAIEVTIAAALLSWSSLALLSAAWAWSLSLLLLALALPAGVVAWLAMRRGAAADDSAHDPAAVDGAARRPGLGWGFAASQLLGMILVLAHARIFTTMFVAEAGLLELPFAFDPILGAVLGLPVALLLPGLWPIVAASATGEGAGEGGRRLAPVLAVAVLATLACLAFLAFLVAAAQPAYTAARPKRVFLAHGDEAGATTLYAAPYDAVGFPPALVEALGLAPAAGEVLWFSTTHAGPVGATGLVDPAPRIVARSRDPAAGTRGIRLTIDARGATDLIVRAPPGSIAGWSLDTPPPTGEADTLLWIVWPRPAHTIDLELASLDPIELEITTIDALGRSDALARAVAALPEWATPHTRRYRRVWIRG